METPQDKEQKKYSVTDLCENFIAFCNANLPPHVQQYIVNDSNQAVIKNLVLYFAEHEECVLNPAKGIYLRGPVGTGKSFLMRTFSKWPHTKKKFIFESCRDIQQEFAIGGFQRLLKYSKKSYRYAKGGHFPGNGAITFCFDEFGGEGRAKYYGNDISVMEEIMQDRYNEYETHGMLTHVTTNLIAGEVIQKEYGVRVRDRIRGMFNLITLDGESFRK